MNTWQKVFEYMDGYTEQVDLVKIKLRQKQALGLLAGAIADGLTGETLRPYLQNLVKVQTVYAGSPPRMRVKLSQTSLTGTTRGITPAHAGKTTD